jgi:hypothetical protein
MKSKKSIISILAVAAMAITPVAPLTNNTSIINIPSVSAAYSANETVIDGIHYSFFDDTAYVTGIDSDLTNVRIPINIYVDGRYYYVREVSTYAFNNALSLESIDFSHARHLTTVKYGAFKGASNLKTVTLSPYVTNIEASAFQDCTSLLTFDFNGNNSISSIDSETFKNCSSLLSINLPDSVSTIGYCAFENTGITKLAIKGGVDVIGASAFRDCNKLNAVYFSASDDNSTLKLKSYAFFNCDALDGVIFNRVDIDSDIDVFWSCNDTRDDQEGMKMQGQGVPSFTASISKKLVDSWDIHFDENDTEIEKVDKLIELGHKLHNYVRYAFAPDGTVTHHTDMNCSTTTLSTRIGVCGGYARSYYNLAVAAGFAPKDFLIGGDGHCHGWNFVRINGLWYNFDACHDFYFATDSQYCNHMSSNFGAVSAHTSTYNWVVDVNDYYHTIDMFSLGAQGVQYFRDLGLGERAQ